MNLSEEEANDLQKKLFINSYRSGYKQFKGYEMLAHFGKFQEQIDNMEVYDDDVWVLTFPKSGTTWTQEIVWCMCNKMDFKGAKVDLDVRFPFLEICVLFEKQNAPNSIQAVNSLKRPRFIKTHLPWELLPKQIREFRKRPKIINVTRKAEDACISYYHHATKREFYRGTMEEYCLLFLHNKIIYTPFFKHILSIWNHRKEENILILKYEDMKMDCLSQIKKIAAFLEIKLSPDDADELLRHCSFDEMKHNPAVQHAKEKALFNCQPTDFFRKGVVGSHKEEMNEDLIKAFKIWTEECLKGIDVDY